MTAIPIQSAASQTTLGVGGSTTVTFTSPTTKGNWVIVGVFINATNCSITSMTDDAGQSYALQEGPVDLPLNNRVLQYAVLQTVGGASTITIQTNATGSTAQFNLYASEFAAVSGPTGTTSTGSGTSDTPAVASFSPQPRNLVVATLGHSGLSGQDPGTGYTEHVDNNQGGQEYLTLATDTETAPWTILAGSLNWVEVAVEYANVDTTWPGIHPEQSFIQISPLLRM